MTLATYDPKKVTTVWGPLIISGFMKGTFVTVDYNEEAFKLIIGSGGEGARSKNNNLSARFIITLLQTSASNLLIATQHLTDFNSVNGLPQPFTVKDLTGNSLSACENAWVVKMAKITYADEIQGIEWTLETDSLDSIPGGNF